MYTCKRGLRMFSHVGFVTDLIMEFFRELKLFYLALCWFTHTHMHSLSLSLSLSVYIILVSNFHLIKAYFWLQVVCYFDHDNSERKHFHLHCYHPLGAFPINTITCWHSITTSITFSGSAAHQYSTTSGEHIHECSIQNFSHSLFEEECFMLKFTTSEVLSINRRKVLLSLFENMSESCVCVLDLDSSSCLSIV